MALEIPHGEMMRTPHIAHFLLPGPAWFQLPLMRTPNILRQMVHGQHCQRLLDQYSTTDNQDGTFTITSGTVPHALDSEILSKELLAADGNWYPLSTFPNTNIASGVVAAGGNNFNKVWKTDGTGKSRMER